MRSPLEAIAGEYEHAIFTTYSIGLSFFERWVLPTLAETGVRNVVVFADADQVGEALLDPGAQRVGTAYQLIPMSLGTGAFHPKVMFLNGKSGQRLVVSSSNLTVSGQLRNLEICGVLDSMNTGHGSAISEAAGFFRRLAEEAPAHTTEAVFLALEGTEESPTRIESSQVEFIHNLDQPIVSRLPEGRITATVAYTDGDGRTLQSISSARRVICIVDGDSLEAGEGFFEAANDLEVREFSEPKRRTLHAKAYWSNTHALVGSPNLSHAGLLDMAASGNVEAALLFATEDPLTDPGGQAWVGDIQKAARTRASKSVNQVERTFPTAFRAWEEEGQIHVDGISDGVRIDRYAGVGWEAYGEVREGRIVPYDEAHRPRLLRGFEFGTERLAAVHRVVELRIRRLRRMSGRSSEVMNQLPLDLEGVRLVEGVLGELFALGELAEGEASLTEQASLSGSGGPEVSPLSEWRPAHEGDEPRIPDIYRRTWSKDPDALLALVHAALRLDPASAFDKLSEFDLESEDFDLEEAEDLADAGQDVRQEEDSPPVTTQAVLRSYRGSFRRLLDRGVKFIEVHRSSVLGDLAFQTLMQQSERLLVTVEVDGEIEYLVDPVDVRRFRLQALHTYLRGDEGIDPLCKATARYHLADLIRNEADWDPLEWERIEGLGYRYAMELLREATESDPPELLGLTGLAASAWLADYATRADWLGVVEHASEALENVDFTLDPFPVVAGFGQVAPFAASPAWELIGYAAVAGMADEDPFGVVVISDTQTAYDAHIVAFDPTEGVLYEALRRGSDGLWMWRVYRPIGRGDLERAGRMGPQTLMDADKSPLTGSTGAALPEILNEIVAFASANV